MPATTKESCHWTITSFVISINSSHTYKFTLDTNSGPWYGCACYLEQTALTPPAAPALTLVLSIAWSLFTFFFRLPPFVFNSLQPLFPKHPGGGCPPARCLPVRQAGLCACPDPVGVKIPICRPLRRIAKTPKQQP